MAGVPCSFRWRLLSSEPLEVVLLLSMPILEVAPEKRYGGRAQEAHFGNASGIEDPQLVSLPACLRGELAEPKASALFVRAMADAIAAYLAHHYVDVGASQLEVQAFPPISCGWSPCG